MDTILSIQIFRAVAARKSFADAADQLGISPAMATKHVQKLEARVGARLLNRTSRKVSLTEAGEIYLNRASTLVDGLKEAESLISESAHTPRGLLRISLPEWMTTPNFTSLLSRYHQAFPQVRLELDPSASSVNVLESRYDLALRVGDAGGEGLVAKKIAVVQLFAVASPAFLEKHGRPENLPDLHGIPYLAYTRKTPGDFVRYKDDDTEWQFSMNPIIKSENENLILLSALEGLGVAILPQWLVSQHIERGRLMHILADVIRIQVPMFLLYPDKSYMPAKTLSFIDFMLQPETLAQM